MVRAGGHSEEFTMDSTDTPTPDRRRWPLLGRLRLQFRDPELELAFRDDRFRHNATPLLAAGDGIAQRDAMVCTVNYPDTYELG